MICDIEDLGKTKSKAEVEETLIDIHNIINIFNKNKKHKNTDKEYLGKLIAHLPLGYNEKQNFYYIEIINGMIEENINDRKKLNTFLLKTRRNTNKKSVKKEKSKETVKEKNQKKYNDISHSILLHAYRRMLYIGLIDEDKTIEHILIAKKSRGESGVIVVTVFTAGYFKTENAMIIEQLIARANRQNENKSGQKRLYNTNFLVHSILSFVGEQQMVNFSCDDDCHFCPDQPGQPRSYIIAEPGVQRANRCGFDPIKQFQDRARAYIVNGHELDKIELLVLGGTWSSYPRYYQDDFINKIYYAANTMFDYDITMTYGSTDGTSNNIDLYDNSYSCDMLRDMKSIDEEQKINEDTMCKIIGLTLETRPDKICGREIVKFRYYGVTRVQLGIQHISDVILKKNNRGHYLRHSIKAIKLLKNAGLKVDIHIMLDLPGSNKNMDLFMMIYIIFSIFLQADQWKQYPCETTPYTEIEKWYKNGSYKPYAETVTGDGKNVLSELLIMIKSITPPHIRINRVVRDIPNQYIIGGNQNTSMRQDILSEMHVLGLHCKCIRCREVKGQDYDVNLAEFYMHVIDTVGGTEYFLSYEFYDEIKNKRILFGFLRLRLPIIKYDDNGTKLKEPIVYYDPDIINKKIFPELHGCAMIRELHTYGKITATYNTSNTTVVAMDDATTVAMDDATTVAVDEVDKYNGRSQHAGIGTKLIKRAEEIALKNHFKKLSVISGIGVKNYYRNKHAFKDDKGKGKYLIKNIESIKIIKHAKPINHTLSLRTRVIIFGICFIMYVLLLINVLN
jgi:ELP3 family radical SAM enzyme/protein acetyltransferase